MNSAGRGTSEFNKVKIFNLIPSLFKWGVFVLLIFLYSCGDGDLVDEDSFCRDELGQVEINKIQLIGSHNSYRIRPPDHIMELVRGITDIVDVPFDPESWDYTHVPIVEQLDQYMIRSLELDIYRDPDGGLFYDRKGDALVGMDPDSGEEMLLDPGLKILHFPDFDYLSHHLTFKNALETIRLWSLFRPSHVPLIILVQAKEDSPYELIPNLGLTKTLPFDLSGVQEIDSEIEDVFGNNLDLLLTPDLVRGNFNSIREAVMAGNWPLLGESRGKIIFILMADDETVGHYLQLHPSLEGSYLFVFSDPEDPEAAFIKIDDPIANYELIKQNVAEGFMVRTRSDADTYEARSGDYMRMMAAFDSGAQIISTDYYRYDARALEMMGWTDYEVRFPDASVAILNAINGPNDLNQCEVME